MTVQPHDLGATIDAQGHIQQPEFYDRTRQTGVSPTGDWSTPDFGPGHIRTTAQIIADGQNHRARHELTYTIAPRGIWSEDDMSGLHAMVGSEGVETHYGYMEPWGIELANDRWVDTEAMGHWDDGLAVPGYSQEYYF